MLLADRQNDFFNNNLSCQDNCEYSSYSEKSAYMKCECRINNKNITLESFKSFLYKSFSSVIKSSYYQFLKCYKLVFHINSLTKNYGSIILIILILIHIVILIIYIIKGVQPLKMEIVKIIEEKKNTQTEKKSLTIRKQFKRSTLTQRKKIKRSTANFFPPKKEGEVKTADAVNKEWAGRGYDNPPYDPDYDVIVVKGDGEEFVRVYTVDESGSNRQGGWLMKKSDIEGLTAQQIADKYALPKTPTHICDVKIPSDFDLETGFANPVEGWGNGGGQQFDTMGKRLPGDSFFNDRLIGD